MNEISPNNLPDFLQNIETTDNSIEGRVIHLLMEVDEFLLTQFSDVQKVKDFVAKFQQLFPAGTSYVQEQDDRLDPSLLSQGKVACNMAALVMGSWIEQHKPLHRLVYLVKRGKQRNHTMLGVVKEETISVDASSGWKKVREDIISQHVTGKEKYGTRFYRLTEDLGLFQLSDVEDALSLIGFAEAPARPDVPQRGYVFTNSHDLARYLLTDKEYRRLVK